MKKITVLGGGTGSYAVLTALKTTPQVDLAAIVTMLDSGGSTGKLRDQLGVLPPGDLRQCLVALSEAPEIWRKLFTYRFEQGDLKGHSFGNIFISALEKISNNYDEVLDEVHYVMQCIGRVIPATLNQANIEVTYNTGRVVSGEKDLDELNPDNGMITKAIAVPQVKANPKALERIKQSDVIIAGPGDLYSSIISISLAEGISDSIQKSNAKLIYIMNLMTKASQTYGYGAWEHIRDFHKYFGKLPDVCIVNEGNLPTDMIKRYQEFGEVPVVDNLKENGFNGQVIKADLVDTSQISEGHKNESLASTFAHSIVRHDINKLEEVIKKVI
ncbi:MAG: gluconeogenesis factor YvcK family protein [Patescibacteria group bacterium]